MGPTNQPLHVFMFHCWEPPSPFSVFPRGRRQSIRHLWVPLDISYTSSVHCRNSANPARRLLFKVRRSFTNLSRAACHSAATPGVYNENQDPDTESRYQPTREDPTPCNTASGRSSSRVIRGKALPTHPFLARM